MGTGRQLNESPGKIGSSAHLLNVQIRAAGVGLLKVCQAIVNNFELVLVSLRGRPGLLRFPLLLVLQVVLHLRDLRLIQAAIDLRGRLRDDLHDIRQPQV